MAYLVMRIQKQRDDGTTIDEWVVRHANREPTLERIVEEAKKRGYEVHPPFGYKIEEWPMNLVCYVSGSKEKDANGFWGRNSTLHLWPCRKIPT